MNTVLKLLMTFEPLLGVLLTFSVAGFLRGIPRWIVLLLGPLATLGIGLAFGKWTAANGNLLFAGLFGLLFMFIVGYYPTLVIYWLWKLWKRRHSTVELDRGQ